MSAQCKGHDLPEGQAGGGDSQEHNAKVTAGHGGSGTSCVAPGQGTSGFLQQEAVSAGSNATRAWAAAGQPAAQGSRAWRCYLTFLLKTMPPARKPGTRAFISNVSASLDAMGALSGINNSFHLCWQYFLHLLVGCHTSVVSAYRCTYHNGSLTELCWNGPFNPPFNSGL